MRAASRRASVSACSCSEPAEHDVRHQRELALDRLPDVGMVIAVAGRPPRRDPVDQFASVGQHDAGALRADHRRAAGAPSSSARKAARHGRARPGTTRAPRLLGCLMSCDAFSASIRGSLPPFCPRRTDKADARMRSLDEFATAKLGELERSSLRRALVDTTRVTGIWLLRDGRRLLSFSLQRLPQPDPSSRGQERRRSRRCGSTASVPAPPAS